MTEKPIIMSGDSVRAILDGRKTQMRRVKKSSWVVPTAWPWQKHDSLWVRETFCYGKRFGYDAPDDGRPGVGYDDSQLTPIWYLATDCRRCEGPWRPSIFMPKEAARIWLEVTGVRAQRVQDITSDDVEAEGIDVASKLPALVDPHIPPGGREELVAFVASTLFRQVWDSLNAKRGYGWDTNPKVWVIEFRRTEK